MRIYTIRRTRSEEQREIDRGYQRFKDREPLSACRSPNERIGWREAEDDKRAESRLIIVP